MTPDASDLGTDERGWLERWLAGLPRWLRLLVVAAPLAFGVVGWVWAPTTSAENARAVVGTLARFQGGVLAIVFSVTVLGVQLISRLYSPRMLSLFVRAPVFRFTFVVFLLSVGVDLALLYATPTTPSRGYVTGVFVAVGLAVVAVGSLYAFVATTLERSTPEGIVAAFVDDLDPATYHRRAERALDPGDAVSHPLHPIYSLTMSAVSGGEWTTAERGIDAVADVAGRALLDGGSAYGTDPEVMNAAFDAPLLEYLPGIARHAFESGETGLVEAALDALVALGRTGLDTGRPAVVASAARGLAEVVETAPPTADGSALRAPALERLGTLTCEAADRPGTLTDLLSVASGAVGTVFVRDAEGGSFAEGLSGFLDDLVAVGGALLESHAEVIAAADVDWEVHPGEEEGALGTVLAWRSALLETTGGVVASRERTGTEPVPLGTLVDAWRTVCVDACWAPDAGPYATALCQAYVEAAYAVSRVYEGATESWWAAGLAGVAHEGDRAVVGAALDRTGADGYTPRFLGIERSHEVALRGLVDRVRLRGDRESPFEAWHRGFRAAVESAVDRRREGR